MSTKTKVVVAVELTILSLSKRHKEAQRKLEKHNLDANWTKQLKKESVLLVQTKEVDRRTFLVRIHSWKPVTLETPGNSDSELFTIYYSDSGSSLVTQDQELLYS